MIHSKNRKVYGLDPASLYVGQPVRIKEMSEIPILKEFPLAMQKQCGMVLTIKHIYVDCSGVTLHEDTGGYLWHTNWIECV